MKRVLSWIGIVILLAAAAVGWVLYMGAVGERDRMADDLVEARLTLQNAAGYISQLQQQRGQLIAINGAAALRIKELEVRLGFYEGLPLPGEGNEEGSPFSCRAVMVLDEEYVMCPFFEPRDQWERRQRSSE